MRNSAVVQVPGSWNRYAYAYNDPVNRSDPSGLTSCDVNGDNCYDSIDVTDDEDGDYQEDTDISYSAQRTGGAPAPPKLLLIRNLQKSGANYNRVVSTFNKIAASIDPDCQSFLQTGGNNVQGYISDLLSNNLLAVGDTDAGIAAITGTGRTNLDPGAAAIVVNNLSVFFNSNFTIDQRKLLGGTATADAFILLHELGHALEATGIKPDGPSVPNGQQNGIANDNAIDQHCQKTLSNFR